jgi:membrane protease YdiL (CAAX protease family)
MFAWCPDVLHKLTGADWAEIVLLAIGSLMVLVGIALVTARRRWAQALTLSVPCEHDLTPADLLVGFLGMWTMPPLFYYLLKTGHWFAHYLVGGASWSDALSAPASTAPEATIRTLSTAAGEITAALILLGIGALRIRGGLAGWGLGLGKLARRLGTAVLIFIAAWPVCYGMLYLTRLLLWYFWGVEAPPEHTALVTLRSPDVEVYTKLAIGLNAIVLAPLTEEMFFRGLLQSAVARWSGSPWAGVAAASLAFGAVHLQVADTVPTMMIFGGILAATYARTGSLTLVILVHAVFNAKNVLQAVLLPGGPQ